MDKDEAQSIYRAAWSARCLATTKEQRRACEQSMDAVQSDCVDGGRPGPEWTAFIATLPGYNAFWAGMDVEAQALVDHWTRLEGKAHALANRLTRRRGR